MKFLGIARLITVVVFLSSVVIPLSAAKAIEYGGFGGRPAYPRTDNPRTESIFIQTLEPGAKVSEGVVVVNNSAETKTLMVYATDSTPSTGGAFACKQFSEDKLDIGAWINLAKSEVMLEPGTSEVVPFTISAPKSAAVGEHDGCINIQEKKVKQAGQVGALLSVRTGLRVAVTIPGEIVRKLELAGFTLTLEKGVPVLHPQVKNTGNVSIDANIKVAVSYFFGLPYKQYGGQFPIMRGETSDWNFEIKKPFFGGWYRSAFVVDYDKNSEASVGVQSGKDLTTLTGPTIWFWSAPTPGGLATEIAVVLLLVAVVILCVKNRRNKKWIQEKWVEQVVGAGDDINSLAKRFAISWKLLAKVNGLKPPYVVKPGEKIKTPPLR